MQCTMDHIVLNVEDDEKIKPSHFSSSPFS